MTNGWLWTALYVVAVVGAPLRSSYQSVVVFGFVNLLGLTLVALLYTEVSISLWCVQAAVASLLVLVHMFRRHRVPDADRLEGRLAYEPVGVSTRTARTSE